MVSWTVQLWERFCVKSVTAVSSFINTVYQQPLGLPTRGRESLPEWHSYRAAATHEKQLFGHGHSCSACSEVCQEKQSTFLDLYLRVCARKDLATISPTGIMMRNSFRPGRLFPALVLLHTGLGPGCAITQGILRETGLMHKHLHFRTNAPALVITVGLCLPLSESQYSSVEEVRLGKPLLARISWKGSEVLQRFSDSMALKRQTGPFCAAALK